MPLQTRPRWALLLLTATLGAAHAQATPLTLDAALAQVNRAPQAQAAALTLQKAQADLNSAQAALGLNVAANGSGGYTAAGGLTLTAGVTATLGVLPWASAQSTLRDAQARLRLAQLSAAETLNATRLNAATTYLNAHLAQLDLDLAAQTLTLRETQLANVTAQRADGNATQESVLNATAAVQTARASVATATATLDAARRSLAATLGTPLDGVTFTSAAPDASAPGDVDALIARARSTSSDVVQAQADVTSAQDALASAQRDRTLPDLNVTARYGANGGGLSAGLNLKAGTASVGYSQPILTSSANSTGSASGDPSLSVSFSGGVNLFAPAQDGQIAGARTQLAQAQLALSLAGQNLELDVRQKYADALNAAAALTVKTTQLQAAQQALATAQARADSGLATPTDVTAAQLAVRQAERDLEAARVSAYTATLKLQNAAGGPQ
ncbi:TolC family protein [Deinococcus maricopensis]|uniref:Outer membrane efflux protein n=1 Tax=Deinococcus maricopensis (strain DSM 21211 / LMG 22137 / NRRL B-23946 / LB-34) TaxID=709986 RepID=E8U663_DEIML|nr:TolC family protein [Deinococcus maricopensis]ADV66552.1 outer membrane efflux protein [Deinococcus maricopensis DSM 21211]